MSRRIHLAPVHFYLGEIQAWLRENGNIELHYCSMSGPTDSANGAGATIGINVSGANALSIAYDTAGNATSGTGCLIAP